MTSNAVLLVSKSEELKKNTASLLSDHFGETFSLQTFQSLQEAIEHIEQNTPIFDLVLVEQLNSSVSLLKLLVGLAGAAPMIVMCPDEAKIADLKSLGESISFILPSQLEAELLASIKKLEFAGKLKLKLGTDSFASIRADQILKMKPLPIDVYLTLGGKQVKIFRQGDEVTEQDVTKYSGQTFYLRKDECDQMFQEQVKQIEAASEDPIDLDRAHEVAYMSQELVKSLISDVGFTPEAQRIAKASVNMSLKILGSKPKLNVILQELKKKQGNFVTSHSFLLGQLACGMSYTVGWKSPSTYFKLSMAAFLHDIALNINTDEQELTYEEAVRYGRYNPEELKVLRFHPMQAAEYTRQFSEIPADVEQILAQHHERPNGSGYPRGMSSKHISPMSAIFIIAHDLILFMMRHPDIKVEKFYELNERYYAQNPFRKIIAALRGDIKIA